MLNCFDLTERKHAKTKIILVFLSKFQVLVSQKLKKANESLDECSFDVLVLSSEAVGRKCPVKRYS